MRSACNILFYQWNYGTSRNLAEAKKIIAAVKASGYKFGIYSSPGEWSSLFGSYSVVVDSSAPLWFATYNNVQVTHLNIVLKLVSNDFPRRSLLAQSSGGKYCIIFFNHLSQRCSGRWTTAVGHQYTDQSASKKFDLNVFAS